MPLPNTSSRPSLAIQGSLPPTAQATRELARIPRSPNFFYKFHPSRWMYVELGECGECSGCKDNQKQAAKRSKGKKEPCINAGRGEFLPSLGKLKLDGGVGGCDYNPISGFKIKDALENARQNGWTVLMPQHVGVEYVRVYETPGGKAHLSMWERVIPQPGRRPAAIVADTAAYHDWLRGLISDGIIPPIDPRVAEVMIEQLRERINRGFTRRASMPTNNPALDSRLDAEGKRLQGMVVASREISHA